MGVPLVGRGNMRDRGIYMGRVKGAEGFEFTVRGTVRDTVSGTARGRVRVLHGVR